MTDLAFCRKVTLRSTKLQLTQLGRTLCIDHTIRLVSKASNNLEDN